MAFTRTDLINSLMDRTDLSRREASEVVHIIQDQVTRALAAQKTVRIFGFGSFVPRQVPPHETQTPGSRKKMWKDEVTGRVTLKASPMLREFIAGTRPLPEGDRLVTGTEPKKTTTESS